MASASIEPAGAAPSFAEIARLLQAEPGVEGTLDQIVELARGSLDCDFASVTMLHSRKRVETPAATHEVVREADALQYQLEEGPCLQSIWSHDTFLVEDLASDSRWPRWGPRAAKLGLRSILAVRLFTHRETQGALNLYASTPDRFDEDDVHVAHLFAAQAAVALSSARNEEHLRKAVDARHLIGQAQGILMERFDVSADRAFDVLRRYSNTRNVKLNMIAAEVVAQRAMLRVIPDDEAETLSS